MMAVVKKPEPIADPEAAFERFKQAVAAVAAAPKSALERLGPTRKRSVENLKP